MTRSDNQILELTVPAETVDDLTALAAILRGGCPDPLATLLQDAIRTYVWILRQQATGRIVLTVDQGTITWITAQDDAPDDIARPLVRFIPDGADERVLAVIPEPQP